MFKIQIRSLQAFEKTKALIVPKDTFQRFADYRTEEDRKAEQREKEAAKVAALKKASYEKTKTWDATIEVHLSSFDSVLRDMIK